MLPHPPGWHPEDVKAALRKLGWTQKHLADELDLCRRTVFLTIQNGRSQRCCEFISNLLGTPPQEIWPSRYRLVRTRPRTERSTTKKRGSSPAS